MLGPAWLPCLLQAQAGTWHASHLVQHSDSQLDWQILLGRGFDQHSPHESRQSRCRTPQQLPSKCTFRCVWAHACQLASHESLSVGAGSTDAFHRFAPGCNPDDAVLHDNSAGAASAETQNT